ncbi:MAG TPA: DUF2891 domain-containing protein [Rhizomicrobium sp.]|nr:DUF2891 domain-containing protein [Rhizomicrobium sp.]
MELTPQIASHFARTALGHVTREWPNKLDHTMAGEGDVQRPRALHPVFYGSFDWHSCVHGYWLLARLYRRFPHLQEAAQIKALFDTQFTAENLAGEIAYLARPQSRGFERPYGWAWALMLTGELAQHQSEEGRHWAAALKPFGDAFVQRFESFLPLATYPVRAGVHSNTAFALLLALNFSIATGNSEFAELCRRKAREWYANDVDCQAWEPSQDEFLSPTLMEAACMHMVLSREEFAEWFAGFLPRAAEGEPRTLFTPASVSDRSDGKIAHLDGLNLSRAWCWRLIADGLKGSAPPCIAPAIARHLEAALDHVTGDYMGEHWLVSFALLALDPDI